MTVPPAVRPILRSLSSALAALLVACAASGQPEPFPAASTRVETALGPNASVEGSVRGGETRVFDLQLDTGTFLFVEIVQSGLNVSSKVLSPGQSTTAEGEGFKKLGSQFLTLIADEPGTYRIDLTGQGSPIQAGRYKVLVRAWRPTLDGDENRVRGASLLTAARRLLSADKEDSGDTAEVLLADSILAWQEAGDARGEAEALLEIAELRSEKGDMPGALSWWKKALDRSKESDHAAGEARALAEMGYCNSQLGEHDEAIRLYLLSLELLRKMDGAFERATTLVDLGIAYQKKQDFQAALQAFEDALPLAEVSTDPVLKARVLTGIGAGHFLQYRYAAARENWQQALELCRQAGEPQLEADLEQNLAAIYHNEGKFQQALDLFTHAVANVSAKESGMAFYNMGNLYLELGDPETARKKYELSRQAFQAKGNAAWEANASIGIGWALQRMGKALEAVAEYEKARQLVRDESWNVAYSIGRAQIDLGKPGEAIPFLQRALGMARANGDRSREAPTLLALGSAHAELDQPEQAFAHLGEAIAVGRQIGHQSVVALSFLKRSILRRDQGRLKEALADGESALGAIESTRRNMTGDQLRTGFFAAKRTYYDLQIDLLMRLDRLSPGQGYADKALVASEMSRARGLLDMLVEGRLNLTKGIDPVLKQKESDVAAQLFKTQTLLMDQLAKDSNEATVSDLRAQLEALEQERQETEWKIRSEHLLYANVRYPSPLRREEIQGYLPEDTALLEYFLGQEASYLFIITRDAFKIQRLPDSSLISQEVEAVRNGVEQTRRRVFSLYSRSARRLYEMLVAPAQPILTGKRHLVISPDGPLQSLPFEMLLTGDGKGKQAADLPYLVRDFSVSYIPSAGVLSWIASSHSMAKERGEPAKQFLAFADPLFGYKDDERAKPKEIAERESGIQPWGLGPVRRLKGTAREVAEIAALYPTTDVQLYIGEQANEGNVKANPLVETARRIHFATHGVINERLPELSGLRMARTASDDGILQVHEIFNLSLNAELVVLSACKTGLGKEVTGEGLIGMTRAFLYAGTPSIVVSLWEVADTAAPNLMLHFYKNMKQTGNKAEALRQAKLEIIERGSYASRPFHWAPFILVGRP